MHREIRKRIIKRGEREGEKTAGKEPFVFSPRDTRNVVFHLETDKVLIKVPYRTAR